MCRLVVIGLTDSNMDLKLREVICTLHCLVDSGHNTNDITQKRGTPKNGNQGKDMTSAFALSLTDLPAFRQPLLLSRPVASTATSLLAPAPVTASHQPARNPSALFRTSQSASLRAAMSRLASAPQSACDWPCSHVSSPVPESPVASSDDSWSLLSGVHGTYLS